MEMRDQRRAQHVPIRLRLVDIGLAQARQAVLQHGAVVAVDEPDGSLHRPVLGGYHLVQAVLGEQRRPVLQPVVIQRMRVAGEQVLDGEARADIHDHGANPIISRYWFQKPRTEASEIRLSALAWPAPPISTTLSSPSLPWIARCTQPPTQPSSMLI